MKALLLRIKKILRDRRIRRFFTRFVSAFAAFVVFITTYALVLPAITMESEAACGIEAHQHDDSCFEEVLSCGLEESEGHTHDDSCYTVSQKLVCTVEEHRHSAEAGCFDEDGSLICETPEHVHDGDCYEEIRELTCGLEESEGHTHDASCYEKVLACGKEAHIHSPECYKEESSAVAASTGAAAVEAASDGSADDAGNAKTGDGSSTNSGRGEDSAKAADPSASNGAASTAAGSAEAGALDDSAAAATTGVLPDSTPQESLSDGYVPALEEVNMDSILTRDTGFYYFHAEEGEEIPASSAEIQNWKELKADTVLAPGDLLRMYLPYTIPAGALNETNQIARYRLPANLHLTDAQILAINETVNGIASRYVNYDSLEIRDTDAYHKYLGAEAIEGARTPDRQPADGAQEYISAVVKAENVYDEEGLYGEKGAYLGQDLIFIFTPYTIEKNQITYDPNGNPTAAGEKVTGWFACDLNTEQVEWEIVDETEETIPVGEEAGEEQADPAYEEQENSTSEGQADQESQQPADLTNEENSAAAEGAADTAAQEANSAPAADASEETPAEELTRADASDADDAPADAVSAEATAEQEHSDAESHDSAVEENDSATGQTGRKTTVTKTVRTVKKEAEILFVQEDRNQNIREIKATLHLQETSEAYSDTPETDPSDVNAEQDKAADDASEGSTEEAGTDRTADAEEAAAAATQNPAEAEADDGEGNVAEMPAQTFNETILVRTARVSAPAVGSETSVGDAAVAAADSLTDSAADSLTDSADEAARAEDYIENLLPEEANLTVHAEADEGTFPAGTTMVVTPITGDDLDAVAGTLADSVDGKAHGFQAVDISFRDAEGNEIEPARPIRVTMSSEVIKKASETTAVSDPVILHLDNEGNAEEITQTAVSREDMKAVEAESKAEVVSFEADSFSAYVLVYTVDFTYNNYQISIPGGSSVLVSKLNEELGFASDGNGAPFSVSNIKNVTFSNPDLVKVTRIEEDTTVNDLLTMLDEEGIETWMPESVIVRTEDKSDAEVLEEAETIDQMDNETAISSGDWVLTALQAFHSEETLTIEMTDGSKYVIDVTDLDGNQNGVKPATVNGIDNTAEGITITMFDYGPDNLDKVGNTYKSQDNSGINALGGTDGRGTDGLKFYSYGTEGSTKNNFTGGEPAMQGIVKSELGADDYPVLANGSSLAYLFNETEYGNSKKVYKNVTGLLQKDGQKLYYSSDKNYAYYNPAQGDNGSFVLYSDTYTEEGADNKDFRIGFFPFNDYDNRYRCIHGDDFRWGCKGQNDWRVRDQVGHYNHHFGMKMEGTFQMTEDKQLDHGNGTKSDILFEYSGDDDMWVFIDDVLVLDIGGIHNPCGGYINFTTGQVHVNSAKTASGGAAYALGTNTTIADAFAKAGKTWDDSPLSQHEIKVFYMERGGMYSNLTVSMSLPTKSVLNDVGFDKTDSDDVLVTGAEFTLYTDEDCTQVLTNKGTAVVKNSENGEPSVLFTGLVGGTTFYMKETKVPGDFLPNNTKYRIDVSPVAGETSTISYYDENTNGWKPLTDKHKDGEGKETYTKVVNKKAEHGQFTLVKVDSTNPNTKIPEATFTLFTDQDCQNIAKGKDGADLVVTTNDDGKALFAGLPVGTVYYLKETQAPEGYVPSTTIYRVEVSSKENVNITKEVDGEDGLVITPESGNSFTYPNKPQKEFTSVTVEKSWSDGNSNHANDAVTVQLYRKEIITRVKGGTINLTVTADKWLNAEGEVVNGTPNSGKISYQVFKNGEGTAVAEGTLEKSNSWTTTHSNLEEITDGVTNVYKVVLKTGDGTTIDNANIYDPERGQISGADGTVKIQGKYPETVNGNAKKIEINASSINGAGTGGDDWKIILQTWRVYKRDNSGYWQVVDKTNFSQSDITITNDNKNNNSSVLTISLPDNLTVDGNAVTNMSDIRFGFQLQTNNWNSTYKLYTSTSPAHYDNSGNGPFNFTEASNGEFRLPADKGNISIAFTTTQPSVSRNGQASLALPQIHPLRLSKPIVAYRQKTNVSSLPATDVSGDDAVITDLYIASGAVPVENSRFELKAENGWSHTWFDLIAKKENQDGEGINAGYKVNKAYIYYVKEVSVHLGNGNPDDVLETTYFPEYNEPNVPESGIKYIRIENTVPDRTSFYVTKKWTDAKGDPYLPDAGTTIKFDVYRKYQDLSGGVYTEKVNERSGKSITFNGTEWSKILIGNLPTKIKVENTLVDVSYYVVETEPVPNETNGSQEITTYYGKGGTDYPEASDAATTGDETIQITNVNSSREIKITKAWFFREGNNVTEAATPTKTDVYFMLKKVNEGGADTWHYSSVSDESIVSFEKDGSRASVYKLHWNDAEPKGWTTQTIKDLDPAGRYFIVETDASGNILLSDDINRAIEISYTDANGKEISEGSPFSAAIPGEYTINNTEKKTSIYVEKVWHAANKENLAGDEPVYFQLKRVVTDGAKIYSGPEPYGEPFYLSQKSGWTKGIYDIPVAPAEVNKEGQEGGYRYYQYYVEELGFKTGDNTYEQVEGLHIRYKSMGSGTVKKVDDEWVIKNRESLGVYSDASEVDWNYTAKKYKTIDNTWLEANRENVQIESWYEVYQDTNGDGKEELVDQYDGTGTLGVLNSSQNFFNKPIKIKKTWYESDGSTQSSKVNDEMVVEIQLMQSATYTPEGGDQTVQNVPYGTPFKFNADEWKQQSDMFEIRKDGSEKWAFEIPVLNSEGSEQLPKDGPFKYVVEESGKEVEKTTTATFEYYIAEYHVYDGDGNDVTADWTSACTKTVTQGNGSTDLGTYKLELQNRETTDLTIHKRWEGVSDPGYVNENVQAVLFKVYRSTSSDKSAAGEDVTGIIAQNPALYGLTESDIYTIQTYTNADNEPLTKEQAEAKESGVIAHYDDYIVLGPAKTNADAQAGTPDSWNWDITSSGSSNAGTDIHKTISKLDVYQPTAAQDGTVTSWTPLYYWVQEVKYLDADKNPKDITTLFHGLQQADVQYPKYSATDADVANLPASDLYASSSPAKTLTNGTGKTHFRTTNTVKDIDINLLKDDEKDNSKKLAGAKFILKRKNHKGVFVTFDYTAKAGESSLTVAKNNPDGQFEIPETAKATGIVIKGLMPGTYELTERKAPDGYNIQGTSMQFTIDEQGKLTKITPTGLTVANPEADKDPRYKISDQSSETERKWEMDVHNTPGAELPSTGGPGTRWIHLLGAALTFLAAATLLARKRP